MIKIKKFHIGARIIKTGIAVALAIYICGLLGLEPRVFAAVSAVGNVQPSIFRSFRNAMEQVFVHVVSVAIAVACGILLGSNPLIIGLATVIIITCNVNLKLTQGIAMGVVAGIFVLDAPQHDFINHAITRSYVVFVGLGSALAVNSFLPQPRYNQNFLNQLAKFNRQTTCFFEDLVTGFIKLSPMSNDDYERRRNEIKSILRNTRSLLELHREQNKYLKIVNSAAQDKWEKYLDYNVKLFYKSQEVYSATYQRLQWRIDRGDPPISDEFQMILGMLERGINSFLDLNSNLYKHVIEGEQLQPVPVNEQFWEELSFFIDEWHVKMTGAKFLHAFMYVSIVANDIKWASRIIKEFSQEGELQPFR